MTWTRECDRILAERCEGRTVYQGNANWPEGGFAGMDSNPCDLYWVRSEPDGIGQCPVAVPHYNTDIAAEKRAAEAWRVQKPRRSYVIYSQTGGHPPVVFLIEAGETIGRAEHLHEALYEAVRDER